MPQDDVRRFQEPTACGIWGLGQRFGIVAVDEDREAACRTATPHVTPPIPDHVTSGKVDAVLVCRIKQHAGMRLIAGGRRPINLVAYLDIVYRELIHQPSMHGFDHFLSLQPSSHVGLVRDDKKQKPRFPELP